MINDYPRMLFDHRNRDVRTVHSRDEEDELGPAWSRKVWSEDDPGTAPEPGGPADQVEALRRAVAARSNPKPQPEPTADPDPPDELDPPDEPEPPYEPPPAKRSHKRKS